MDGLSDNLQCLEQSYTTGGSHHHHPLQHQHHMTLDGYATSSRTSQALTAANSTLVGLGLHTDVTTLQSAAHISHDVTQRLRNDVTSTHASAGRTKHEQSSDSLDTSGELQKGMFCQELNYRVFFRLVIDSQWTSVFRLYEMINLNKKTFLQNK